MSEQMQIEIKFIFYGPCRINMTKEVLGNSRVSRFMTHIQLEQIATSLSMII